MYHVRLKHGAGHSNAFVTVTREKPDAYLENEAAAKYCVDSGFFELIVDKPATKTHDTPIDPDANKAAAPDAPADTTAPAPSTPADASNTEGAADDDEQLESMTVAELRNYAEIQEINLNGATKKAEIIACIKAAEHSAN